MQLHNIKRNSPNKKRRIVGRGGKHAKTSGRGTKGQNARAGHKKRPEIRDFIKRIPKLRGRGKNINTSIETKPVVLSLSKVSSVFKAGDVVSPKTLAEKGLITTSKGVLPKVKVLAGEIDKKLSFESLKVSESVKVAVEKAGGSIK